MKRTLTTTLCALLVLATPAYGQSTRPADLADATEAEHTPGLLNLNDLMTAEQQEFHRTKLAYRARVREYTKELRVLRNEHFGRMKNETIRNAGLDELREFIDPAAYHPMIKVLEDEQDDVRLTMLDHFAEHGEYGDAALAWVAVYDDDKAIRNEARKRVERPVSKPALAVIDYALRSSNDEAANSAASLAGFLQATETIPMLILSLAEQRRYQQQGDLAWIAVQTQRAWVSGLTPVTGDDAGAFAPTLGVINEGTLLRIRDAVAVSYRVDVYRVLVAMTTHDWGQSTAELGYDMRAWTKWYLEEYVPYKKEQAKLRRLIEQEDENLSSPKP